MFRLLRTAISCAVLVAALWAAFAIDLGGHTFAEHVDTISDTPEAQQLIEGTRSTINPALHEVRDRVLGEYVEAPTWIPPAEQAEQLEQAPSPEPDPDAAPMVPASTLPPEAGFEPPLPGGDTSRARSQPSAVEHDPAIEPHLPGR